MENRSLSRPLWLITLVVGFAALLYSFYWGFVSGQALGSSMWLGVTGIAVCLWLGILLIGGVFYLKHRRIFLLNLIHEKLAEPDGRLQGLAVFFILGLASFEFFLFSFMFLPAYFRGFALWGILLGFQGWLLLRVQPGPANRSDAWKLPNVNHMGQSQKRVIWILSAILTLNFILVIPANLHGTEDAGRFLATGEDEVVIYPILTTMYQPADNFRLSLYRWIEYDDYHYGYPFFVVSALVVFPSRILYGPEFGSHYHLNLLLLRQFVSVLPLLLSAFLITYLATRFRSLTTSIMILLLILTIPAVVRYERAFWHPDALAVLFVVLTLFFLDRDRLRFGNDFYLAAVCCGLASAIRLVGFFFIISVAGYLLVGWIRGKNFGRIVSAGAGFLALMCMTILLANPFLFDSGARGRMIDIMSQKSYEMAYGYGDAAPHTIYQTGWETWQPFLEKDFAAPWFIGFLLLSTVVAAIFDRRNPFPALLFGWVVAMGGYLIYFVAVKSPQYGLPVFVPLMGSVAFLPDMLNNIENLPFQKRLSPNFLTGAVYLIILVQFTLNIYAIVRL